MDSKTVFIIETIVAVLSFLLLLSSFKFSYSRILGFEKFIILLLLCLLYILFYLSFILTNYIVKTEKSSTVTPSVPSVTTVSTPLALVGDNSVSAPTSVSLPTSVSTVPAQPIVPTLSVSPSTGDNSVSASPSVPSVPLASQTPPLATSTPSVPSVPLATSTPSVPSVPFPGPRLPRNVLDKHNFSIQFTTNSKLEVGNQITFGNYFLVLQSDGNLVLYQNVSGGQTVAVWDTKTTGQNSSFLILQSDNNLVLYGLNGNTIWSSGTSSKGVLPTLAAPSVLNFVNGKLQIQDFTGAVIWST